MAHRISAGREGSEQGLIRLASGEPQTDSAAPKRFELKGYSHDAPDESSHRFDPFEGYEIEGPLYACRIIDLLLK